ncbi:MAG: SDR family oxidoreductase [Rhodospirillales bacterium]|nr:SDR family oxidoreductase [Rhodospirillales bacterium]
MTAEMRPVALVTGAARRIGAAIARGLAGAGWAVAVHHARSTQQANALVGEIIAAGGKAVAIAADLESEDQTTALIEQAARALGPVTCLINNASIFERDEALTATHESWQRHMQINLRAPFVLIQELARQLPATKSGFVVNILDQRVWNLTPHFVSYTLSKAGLWTLTQSLALALAPRVRVNAVGPGPTLPSSRQNDEQFARQWSTTPLMRPVSPEEIFAAVRFLLDAPAITGQMIAVDAGQHLAWSRSSERIGDE